MKKGVLFNLIFISIIVCSCFSLVSALVTTTDSLGRITSQTDSNGERVSYTYYGTTNNIQRISYSNSGINSAVDFFDSAGNLLAYTDLNYPEKNRQYTYYADGNLKTAKSADSRVSYIYNSENRLHQEINEIFFFFFSPLVTTYEYDSLSRLLKITISGGSTTNFIYSAGSDNLEKEEVITPNADGTTTTSWIKYVYDSNGNILSKEDNLGAKVDYTYESIDYSCQEVSCTTPVSSCGSDTNCITLTNSAGVPYYCSAWTFVTSTCSYDRLKDRSIGNFKVNVNYASTGETTSYTRVDDGTVYTPVNVFDSNGLLREDTEREYTYDSENNLQTATIKDNPTGINSGKINYVWDNQGQVTELTYADGEKERWYYNPLGERLVIVDTVPGVAGPTTSYLTGAVIKNFIFNIFATITGHSISGRVVDHGIIENPDGSTSYTFLGSDGNFIPQKEYNERLVYYEAEYGSIPIEPQVDSTCVDSDNGVNEFNASYVSYKNEFYLDNCTSESTLEEYYCGGLLGFLISPKTRSSSCSYGCIDGSCLEKPLSEYLNVTIPEIIENQTIDLPAEPIKLAGNIAQ